MLLSLWLLGLEVQSLGALNDSVSLTLLVLWSPYVIQAPQSFPQLFHKIPKFHLIFDCESLICFHRLPGNLSEDSYARILSAGITKYC